MNQVISKLIAAAGAWLFCSQIFAQNQPTIVRWDFSKNKTVLENAPPQSPNAAGISFQIPLPDGQYHTALGFVSPIFTAEAAPKFSGIKSFVVKSSGEPSFAGRLNVTTTGFYGFLKTATGLVLIQPNGGKDEYRVFEDHERLPFECLTLPDGNKGRPERNSAVTVSNGATLRTYDMVLVLTDEFEAGNANPTTVATNTVAALNVIYESELAVHFNIAGIALEDATYDINTTATSAYEAVKAVGAYFPNTATYDIGHVFHHVGSGGGSGQAYINAVCQSGTVGNPPVSPKKGGGWTGASDNTAAWWYGLVTHEVGHQFGASHSFNGTAGSCGGGNINPATSYEPGSGTTVMSYSGSCSTDNIYVPGTTNADGDDLHFHSKSLEQIIDYMTSGGGGGCATNSASGNTPPVANANPGNQNAITIPKQTPFTLIGAATDANAADVLNFSWEQTNPGPPHGAPDVAANSTTGPIFRVYSPVSSLSRTFPALTYILNNGNVVPNANYGEVLPGVARTLNFNFQVRDNHAGGGGVHSSPLTVTVDANGPLQVSAPNTAVTWAAGSTQTVSWDVNGTNVLSTCANVNLLLSINGGYSFPYILATNTANDGSQSITIPATIPGTSQARIRVECNTGNQYIVPFDLSNTNFTITNASCAAAATVIYSDAPVSAASGSSSLNFAFKVYNPPPVTSKSFTVVAGDPDMTRARWNSTVTACLSPGGTANYKEFHFLVSQTGTYSFSFGSGNFRAVHLYSNSFNPASPCANFVASSARDGSGFYSAIIVNTSGSSSVQLTAWTEYILVVTDELLGLTTVSLSGAGSFYEIFTSPAGYSYTYVAVNQANNNVAAVSPTASFSSLTSGSYCVYGLSHLNSVTPASYVGQPLSNLLAQCVQLSANCKPVIVTGGGGCTPPNITQQPTNQTVCAGASATFSVVATTGSGSLSYQWRKNGTDIGGATAASFVLNPVTATDAATYTVVVSNAPGCTVLSNSANLTVNQAITNLTFTPTKPTCFGYNNGKLKANPSGGITPYTYLWSNGQTAQTATNLVDGTYTVTITSSNGCTRTGSYTLLQPAAVAVNGTVTNISCNNLNDGKIVATATGGTGTKTFLWNNGATTATILNLSGGVYSVTATDTKGCIGANSFTVTNPPVLGLSVVSQVAASGGKWKVTLLGNGGTPYAAPNLYRYNYRPNGSTTWTLANFGTGRVFTLLPGVYDFGVRDKNLCETILTGVAVPPAEPPMIVISKIVGEGVSIPSLPSSVRVFPNPGTGLFNLELINLPTGEMRLEISNIMGQPIKTETVQNDGSASVATFDLTGFSPGVYLWRVRAAGGFVETLRVVRN